MSKIGIPWTVRLWKAPLKWLGNLAIIGGAVGLFVHYLRYGPKIVKIPPMVAHGCRALDTTHLIYVTSSVYDPAQEGRIPHDDPELGYDFTAGPPVK